MKTSPKSISQIVHQAQKAFGIVGRTAEIESLFLAIQAKQHVLVEGPVGAGKTFLIQAIAKLLDRQTIRIDGDSRFTEQKLTGSFDPSLVLKKGYSEKTFQPGPLTQAMQKGSILFINELNRMPENVQNVMLPALDEGMIQVPYLGTLQAKPGFLVIATQNPREFVATSHLSEALMDRMEWLSLSVQTEEEEIQILRNKFKTLDSELIEACVGLVRFTRSHPKVKRGASIRAAIAMAKLLENQNLQKPIEGDRNFIHAATMSLANRIELMAAAASNQQYQSIIQQIIQEFFGHQKKKDLKPTPNLAAETVFTTAENHSYFYQHPDWIKNQDIMDGTGYDQKDAWDVAVQFQNIKRYANVTPYQKGQLKARAIQGVLDRAKKLVGPVKAPDRIQVVSLSELNQQGLMAEIDLDATIEADPFHLKDIQFLAKIPKKTPIAVVMDVSMSMKGDKLAHLALAASSMAITLTDVDLCFLGFDSKTTWVKRFNEKATSEQIVERILNLPAAGFTNMELALKTLKAEIQSSRYPRTHVVLIGDGKYTEGSSPVGLASDFYRLHVLKIGKDIGGRENLKELAKMGSGLFMEARQYADLPKSIYTLLKAALR